MPAGLQVFNPDGKLRLEITDRLTALHSSYLLAVWTDGSTRTISVPGISPDPYWMATCPNLSYSVEVISGGLLVTNITPGFTTRTNVPITLYRI